MEVRENMGSATQSNAVESLASAAVVSSSGLPQQVMNMAVSMGMERSLGVGSGDLEKKKRERPRKYGPDGSMALGLSPGFSASPTEFSPKRGRGRPPGSGNRQLLAALGEWVSTSTGGNFTPHVVTIQTGEDVAAKIHSFAKKGSRAICVLSANGAISNVSLCQPGSSGGTLTYEGRFEILSLSGSFALSDNGGVKGKTGGLSVSLAGPDGCVIGGGVAGLLLAASPIQLVVGSFKPNSNKEHRRKINSESPILSAIPTTGVVTVARPISQASPEDDTCGTPTSILPGQSQGDGENSTENDKKPNSTSLQSLRWHDAKSEAEQEQKPSPDINICVAGE